MKKSLLRRSVLKGIGLSMAVAILPRPGLAAQNWKFYTWVTNPNAVAGKRLKDMISEISADSQSELSIQYFLGDQLPIKPNNITQAVVDNVIQIGDDGFATSTIPLVGSLRLPGLVRSREEMDAALKIMLPYVSEEFDRKGAVVLGAYYYPQQVLWSSARHKIASLADIKGQKIRVLSPEQAEFIKRAGGVPVSLYGAEVPTALERGVIIGVLTAAEGGGRNWGDLLKYSYQLPLSYIDSYVIANKEAFGALSPAAQASLKARVSAATEGLSRALEASDAEVLADLAAKGVEVIPARAGDGEAATELIQSYWSEWAKQKGPTAEAILAELRRTLGR